MGKIQFWTAYDRPPVKPEMNKDEKLVETAGYIPAQKRIENMINAGQRLVEYRKSQYDFEDESSIDPNFKDPGRSLNFDMADATQLQLSTAERLRASQARQEAARAAAKAQEGVKDVSPSEPSQKA